MKHVVIAVLLIFSAVPLFAHCDSLSGPVVVAAQQALDKGDVTPVLKWVRTEDEKEIRDAFAQTMQVRAQGPAAQALADRWFFETLVRVHRAGEGAPFTGGSWLRGRGRDRARRQGHRLRLPRRGRESVARIGLDRTA